MTPGRACALVVFALTGIVLSTGLSLMVLPAGAGPGARSIGTDISAAGILSHANDTAVALVPQTVLARFSNEGTDPYTAQVNVSLEVWFPAQGAGTVLVFSNVTTVGADLSTPGNSTVHSFPPWTPSIAGQYRLIVSAMVSDDHPENDTVEVTVNAVTGELRSFESVNMGPESQPIERGGSTQDPAYLPYSFKVYNTGQAADSYNISVSSRWLLGSYPSTLGPISPGNASATVSLDVAVPSDAPPASWDTMVVTVTSVGDEDITADKLYNTSVAEYAGVDISVNPPWQKGYPGGPWMNFTFIVTNTGDFPDSFTVKAVARPTSWEVQLRSVPVTPTLRYMESTIIKAAIRVPELDLSAMADDHTARGAQGALVLQVASPRLFTQASVEGLVEVGLVHTVELKLDPPNMTVPWHREGYRDVRFNVSVRSINNEAGLTSPPMEINLTTPDGPSGVAFMPAWTLSPNETESKRWAAGFNIPDLSIPTGDWSQWVKLRVVYPPFPFHGAAMVKVVARPFINASFDGIVIARETVVEVFVEPMLDFSVEPPRWEFFEASMAEQDVDRNGVPDWREGVPGEVIELPFNLTNLGNTWDSYSSFGAVIPHPGSTLSAEAWSMTYPDGKIAGPLYPYLFDPIHGKHSELVNLHVRIPGGAPIGERVNVTLRVLSQTDPSLERRASIELIVKQGYGVDLEPEETSLEAFPDEMVSLRLNVTNTGNGLDVVLLEHSVLPVQGWEVRFNVSTVDLPRGGSESFFVHIRPSGDASADDMLSIKVRAVSMRAPAIFDEVFVNVSVRYRGGMELSPLSSTEVWKLPGERAGFQVLVRNTGNGNDTFDLRLDPGSEAWSYNIEDIKGSSIGSLNVPRGQAVPFWVNITLPKLSEALTAEDIDELGIAALEKVVSTLEVSPRGDSDMSRSLELSVGVLQEFRSGIVLRTGDSSMKEVLPGEAAVFELFLENRGNGLDNIRASVGGSQRHIRWSYVDTSSMELRPFQLSSLNLTVVPDPADLPMYEEEIDLTVLSLAGNNLSYREVRVTATVVMSRLVQPGMDLDLGTTGHITVRLCNMPDPGETPILGFPLIKDYTLASTLCAEADYSEGWAIIDPVVNITLVDLYEVRDVQVRLRAPADLIDGSLYGRVDIDVNGGEGKLRSHLVFARAVFFDCFIDMDRTEFKDLFEGGQGKAFIRLVSTGNRPQEEIRLRVVLEGRTVADLVVGPADPDQFTDGRTQLDVPVEFDLPSLGWYEKARELEMIIMVDPDDQIVENTPNGRSVSEGNNRMMKEFVIENYTPPLPLVGAFAALMIILTAAGGVGYIMHHRRDDIYMLPLAIGLVGIIALVFYLPIEKGGNVLLANVFGSGIILLDLFVLVPLMLYLLTRAGNAYILHLLGKQADPELVGDQRTYGSVLVPISLSLAGGIGIATVLYLTWVVPPYVREDGLSGLFGALGDNSAVVPFWSILFLVVAASLIFQLLLLGFKRRSLSKLVRVWDQLDRLNTEIKEGLQ